MLAKRSVRLNTKSFETRKLVNHGISRDQVFGRNEDGHYDTLVFRTHFESKIIDVQMQWMVIHAWIMLRVCTSTSLSLHNAHVTRGRGTGPIRPGS